MEGSPLQEVKPQGVHISGNLHIMTSPFRHCFLKATVITFSSLFKGDKTLKSMVIDLYPTNYLMRRLGQFK